MAKLNGKELRALKELIAEYYTNKKIIIELRKENAELKKLLKIEHQEDKVKKLIFAVDAVEAINKALNISYETLVDIFADIPPRAPEILQENNKLKCSAELDKESREIALGTIEQLKQENAKLKEQLKAADENNAKNN